MYFVVSEKRCIFAPVERYIESNAKQSAAISTIVNSLPQNWEFFPKPL